MNKDKKPIAKSINLAKLSQPESTIILNTFTIIKNAEFNKVAESKAEIGDGASA